MLRRLMVLGCVAMAMAGRAEANPLLQLDIIGGKYDPITQTTIASDSDFTLVALLTPKATDNLTALLNDTYYISAALMPKVGPEHSLVGSYTWNGVEYDATADMTFGTPPMEGLNATYDPGDFSDPNIFPTFFSEFAFQFSPEQRAVIKYVPTDAGSITPTTATSNISYFQAFNITTSFTGNNVLHFDLYSSYVKRCATSGGCSTDIDVEYSAPLWADAESVNSVPEPTGFMLVSLGLALAARRLRA